LRAATFHILPFSTTPHTTRDKGGFKGGMILPQTRGSSQFAYIIYNYRAIFVEIKPRKKASYLLKS